MSNYINSIENISNNTNINTQEENSTYQFDNTYNYYINEEECRKFWQGFKREGIGIGSLHHWAKMDNLKEYMKIREENLIVKIDNCVFRGGQHDDVAEVVAGYFKDEFICADLKELWFHFDGNKWSQCPKGYLLHKELTGEIKEIFYRRHQVYKKEMDKLSEEGNEVASTLYPYELVKVPRV